MQQTHNVFGVCKWTLFMYCVMSSTFKIYFFLYNDFGIFFLSLLSLFYFFPGFLTHFPVSLSPFAVPFSLLKLFKLQSLHPIGYVAFVGSSLELIHSTIFNRDFRR